MSKSNVVASIGRLVHYLAMVKDRAVILIALGQIVVWAGLFYIFPALLLKWEQSTGWSKSSLAGAISVAVFASALLAPLVGRLIDAGKGPQTMAASAFIGGICLYFLSHITTLWQFYFFWALIGATLAGCLYEPCFALITRARGDQARRTILNVTLIAGFASSISFPLANSLTDLYGWRIALQIFAALVIFLGTPLVWFGAKAMEPKGSVDTSRVGDTGSEKPRENYRQFLWSRLFWLLAIGFALLGVVHGVTLHHLLSILDDRGLHSEVAIVAAAFIGPMQVGGRLVIMACGNRVSNHAIGVSCFIAMAVSIVALWFAGNVPVLLVTFVILFGGGYGMVSVVRPVLARDVLGEQNFGTKSGALATLYLSGTAIAPYLGALVWTAGGYDLVLTLCIVLAGAGLICYALAQRRHQTQIG